MPAELAARYPQIRSFVASDANGRHARIDISPLGLNAMVFEGANVWLVRPVSFGEGREYVSFSRADVAAQAPGFVCGTHTSLDPVIPRPHRTSNHHRHHQAQLPRRVLPPTTTTLQPFPGPILPPLRSVSRQWSRR
jgi:hypothetical protein